jgi:hypothetical protein
MAGDRRFQLKSGRTFAPRLPQNWQTNRASRSDSLRSSDRLSPLMAIESAVVGDAYLLPVPVKIRPHVGAA